MKDGAQALVTVMAHVGATRKHCLQVRETIRDRSDQYAANLSEASKRLDVTEGDALNPSYNAKARLGLTRLHGVLDTIQNS